MNAPWTPERTVDLGEARELLTAAFPRFQGCDVQFLGEGWDNTAFLVDGTWVFRFPRRSVAVPLLQTECRVLPRIASRLPCAVPNPEFVGEPTETFPWPFAGYRHLPGRAASEIDLTKDERLRSARPLGAFLRALHGQPLADLIDLGLPPDEMARLDLKPRLEKLKERLDQLERQGLWDRADETMQRAAEVNESRPHRQDALVHGDLYSRHLLYGEDRNLTGVIDWGDLHHGDPAIDLRVVYCFLPPEARTAFFAGYGPCDDDTLRLARMAAIVFSAALWVYAVDIDDPALLAEGRRGLEYALVDAEE